MSYPDLFKAYYVKTHDGQSFEEILANSPGQIPTDETYRSFILLWLTPDRLPIVDNDPINAIRQGLSFNLNKTAGKNLVDNLFGELVVSPIVIEDFAKYPMRNAFGYDPWTLLYGYVQSPDPDEYFLLITGEYPENFLNDTERVFYLTRGYGRPNPYISHEDLRLRKFYQDASPTALIALSDLLGVCPTHQNPILIKERLSGYELASIDRFHTSFVDSITQCLDNVKLCQNQGITPQERCNINGCEPNVTVTLETCTPDRVNCFQLFLQQHGILSIFEYDPHYNIFVSNISQLDLYRRVIPEKTWDPKEVKSMAPVYVETILSALPDNELIKIVPDVKVDKLSSRLRSTLMNRAMEYLLTPKWRREGNIIAYGREIDDKQRYTYQEMVNSFNDNKALIDPMGNVLDYNSAAAFNDPKINQWIYRTQSYEVENKSNVAKLPAGQQELPRSGASFQGLPEDLILWDRWSYPDRWIPVARRLSDKPTPENLLEPTIEYYREIFPR